MGLFSPSGVLRVMSITDQGLRCEVLVLVPVPVRQPKEGRLSRRPWIR